MGEGGKEGELLKLWILNKKENVLITGKKRN